MLWPGRGSARAGLAPVEGARSKDHDGLTGPSPEGTIRQRVKRTPRHRAELDNRAEEDGSTVQERARAGGRADLCHVPCVWPGVRRAGLPRLSPALTPGPAAPRAPRLI